MSERKVKRLEDLKPTQVAIVDNPANKREFLIVKSADGTTQIVDDFGVDVAKVMEVVHKAADAHSAMMGESAEAMKLKVDAMMSAAMAGDMEALEKANNGFWSLMEDLRHNGTVVSALSNGGAADAPKMEKNVDDPKKKEEADAAAAAAADKKREDTAKSLDADLRAAGEKLLKASGELQKNADADVSADVNAAIELLKKFAGDGVEKSDSAVIKAQADVLGEKDKAAKLKKSAAMVLGLGGVEKSSASSLVTGVVEAIGDLVAKTSTQVDPGNKIGTEQMVTVVDAVSKLTTVMKAVGAKSLGELVDLAKRETGTEASIVAKSLDPFVSKQAPAVPADIVKRLVALETGTAVTKSLGGDGISGETVKKSNEADWSFLVK